MSSLNRALRAGPAAGALVVAAGLFAASSAWAQEAISTAAPGPAPAPAAAAAPSTNATVNLVRLLVQKGVLSQADADGLISQAQSDADAARLAQASAPAAGQLPAAAPGSMRVAYVPQVVRDQIKDEVKQEVMAEAKTKGWIAPNLLPDWVSRITWTGDFRTRDEFDLYSKNNSNDYIDFSSFNSSGPIDINPTTNPGGGANGTVGEGSAVPLLNTRQDRLNILRLRARLGLKAAINDYVDLGVRLASGSDSSPVSTNQTLGGGLSKKSIWLDQAYVNIRPVSGSVLTLGRMPNPWFSTDLVFDDDLNFDGVAAAYATKPAGQNGFGLKGVAGAFPIEYGGNNFPNNSPDKSGTDAKWMYGAQLVADWTNDRFNWRAGLAFYDFSKVQGQLSSPCALYNGNKQCDTDQTRPAFMQKGNSLFLIRNIQANPASPLNFAQPQLVGLVSDFRLLDLTSQFDWKISDRYHLILQGDYVKNLAYDESDVCRYYPLGIPATNVQFGNDSAGNPVNGDPCATPATGIGAAKFQSGDTGWQVRATFGSPRTLLPGQWNISGGYRYLEPDAVLDAFTDSDFHLGGTNAKGYFVAANLGIYRNTWLTARYLSANAVYGPPLDIDVAQIDLNIGF